VGLRSLVDSPTALTNEHMSWRQWVWTVGIFGLTVSVGGVLLLWAGVDLADKLGSVAGGLVGVVGLGFVVIGTMREQASRRREANPGRAVVDDQEAPASRRSGGRHRGEHPGRQVRGGTGQGDLPAECPSPVRSLPPGTAAFTGRERELASLLRRTTDRSRTSNRSTAGRHFSQRPQASRHPAEPTGVSLRARPPGRGGSAGALAPWGSNQRDHPGTDVPLMAGILLSTLSLIEGERRRVTLDDALALCRGFNIGLAELLAGADDALTTFRI
jgi:hypothetical protein